MDLRKNCELIGIKDFSIFFTLLLLRRLDLPRRKSLSDLHFGAIFESDGASLQTLFVARRAQLLSLFLGLLSTALGFAVVGSFGVAACALAVLVRLSRFVVEVAI